MQTSPLSIRPDRRKLLTGAAGVIAAGCLGARAFRAEAAKTGQLVRERVGVAFQTPVSILVAGPDANVLGRALEAGFVGLREVENATSVYRPQSDLSRLNRAGRLVDPHPHLVRQMRYALDLAQATDGTFDPTVQPLWGLWADAHARGERPSDASRRAILRLVDWRGVRIAEDEIRFDRPGMAVTLNSINQGHAADVVMAILAAHGVENAFIDTGEFGARGRHPEGRDWRLGVAAPRALDELAFTLDPFRHFAATSGDYKTFFSPDLRDHHIFDPKTGLSPTRWSSITVTAPTGLAADGLSTALFTMPEPDARRFLATQFGCSARFFDKTGTERATLA